MYFQHGCLMTSEGWLEAGDGQRAVVLQAMDAGFDVWLGNNRGTRYSLWHKTLDAGKDDAYWDFSWAEEGTYDVPASISKVLEVTGYQKLAYVGYSLGTMQMFYGLAKD